MNLKRLPFERPAPPRCLSRLEWTKRGGGREKPSGVARSYCSTELDELK